AGPDASLAAAQGSLGGQQAATPQPSQATSPRVPSKPAASIQAGRATAGREAEIRSRGSAPQARVASYRERTKTAAPVRVTEYWIQAASFTSRDRADELKRELARKGIASLITVKDMAGTSWYRVRVGPYSIKAEAESWLAKVQSVPNCGSANLWTDVALRSR
ncbi:MAG: SPOR domain-containing protein, partial [Treponema sp.]|nr:SPOR domain-containing protein [Treponema sp.]